MTIEVTVWGSEDGDSMGQFFDQKVTPIQPPNGDGGGLVRESVPKRPA